MHTVLHLQPFSKAEIHPLIYRFDTPITIEGECVLRNDHSVNGYHPTVGLFGHLHIYTNNAFSMMIAIRLQC